MKLTCSVCCPTACRPALCSVTSGRSNTVTLRPGYWRASSWARVPVPPGECKHTLCDPAIPACRTPRTSRQRPAAGKSKTIVLEKRAQASAVPAAMAGGSGGPWGRLTSRARELRWGCRRDGRCHSSHFGPRSGHSHTWRGGERGLHGPLLHSTATREDLVTSMGVLGHPEDLLAIGVMCPGPPHPLWPNAGS